MDPYNTLAPLPFDTIEFVLSDAMRASLQSAREAYARGDIKQREVAPGVFVLVRSKQA
jgi:hypothetical protein